MKAHLILDPFHLSLPRFSVSCSLYTRDRSACEHTSFNGAGRRKIHRLDLVCYWISLSCNTPNEGHNKVEKPGCVMGGMWVVLLLPSSCLCHIIRQGDPSAWQDRYTSAA